MRAARARLLELLALWCERGLDRERGGYWNRLDASLAPVSEPHKRLLVHTRLIWSFSEGVLQGAGEPALAAARHGYAFLSEHFRDARRGGYRLTVDRAGAPADERKELYAHAFAVFALAHYARACAAPEALAEARDVLALLRERLSAPGGGWFECAARDWSPLPGPRLQNPHMHLLEALLALGDPDPGARAMADEIFALCADRFVDRVQGCLGEKFRADWLPLADPEGRVVEPGHHFEWVWLLHAYARARSNPEALQLADLLQRFARRHGVDSDGLVFDALERSGRVARDSKRLWPQTEHLKALAARGERDALRAAFARVTGAYVDPASGAWREQLDRAGNVTSTAFNATSVYHVVLALREAAAVL
jgi:mannose/cellobiose epimerase-like protein (N-acyl-D-glucosamine 2-epimerase family)